MEKKSFCITFYSTFLILFLLIYNKNQKLLSKQHEKRQLKNSWFKFDLQLVYLERKKVNWTKNRRQIWNCIKTWRRFLWISLERSQYRNKITCSYQSSRPRSCLKIAKCIQKSNITETIKILSWNDVNMLKF